VVTGRSTHTSEKKRAGRLVVGCPSVLGFLAVKARSFSRVGIGLHCIHMHAGGQMAVVGQSGQSKTVEGLLERGGAHIMMTSDHMTDGWLRPAVCMV